MKKMYAITKNNKILKVEINQSFTPDNPLSKDWLFSHLAFQKDKWHMPCPNPWVVLKRLGKKEDIKGLENMPIDDILFALTARGYAIQPVYVYEHSGIAMSVSPFNDPWDSGLYGFIYITPDEINKNHVSHEEALKELEKAVNLLSRYYDGQIYDVNVYRLTNTELYVSNDIVCLPNWSSESIYSVYECISDINDILDSLKSDLLIDSYFGSLKDAINLLIDRHKETNSYTVKVTKTLAREFEVFAGSKEEAIKAAINSDINSDFDLNQFDKVETKIEVKKGEK